MNEVRRSTLYYDPRENYAAWGWSDPQWSLAKGVYGAVQGRIDDKVGILVSCSPQLQLYTVRLNYADCYVERSLSVKTIEDSNGFNDAIETIVHDMIASLGVRYFGKEK